MKLLARLRPSPAMVIACIALIVALGGTSVAAIQALPKNSVGTKQLKRNAVTSPKIRANAVNGAKIANNSVTGADVNEASLAKVPSAANADNATNATNATTATTATTATSATTATTAFNARGLDGNLASGHTLTGRWALAGHTVGGGFVDENAISFPMPLSAVPAANFRTVGAPPTAACPGSAAAPSAAANNLCVYASNQFGATGLVIGANRFGANIFPTGVAVDSDYELIGTWAVRAAEGAASSAPTHATSQRSR